MDESGIVDAGSRCRGRVTPDFRIAPFFEHVTANEGGYQRARLTLPLIPPAVGEVCAQIIRPESRISGDPVSVWTKGKQPHVGLNLGMGVESKAAPGQPANVARLADRNEIEEGAVIDKKLPHLLPRHGG